MAAGAGPAPAASAPSAVLRLAAGGEALGSDQVGDQDSEERQLDPSWGLRVVSLTLETTRGNVARAGEGGSHPEAPERKRGWGLGLRIPVAGLGVSCGQWGASVSL